jgi:hypothetical protein
MNDILLSTGIYKLFNGNHIDVSKLISIGGVYHDYGDALGGTVSFNLLFQLVNNPIVVSMEGSPDKDDPMRSEWDQQYRKVHAGGMTFPQLEQWWIPIMMDRLKKERDSLLSVWQQYKLSKGI